MDLVTRYLSEIVSFVVGLVSGSLLTLTFKREHRARDRGSVVDQSNARAGGDIVGRDKKN